MYGVYWSLSFPGEKEVEEEKPGITDCLLMRCSGFFVQELPGEIFRRSTATGKTLIAVFVVGETKEYGKKFCLI